MQDENSGETNEPTEKFTSEEPKRDIGANFLLRLALQAKLIDESTYEHANEQLRQDPAFDVRRYLEETVGLDPAPLDELAQLKNELIETHEGDTRRIDETITEGMRLAEEFEKTYAGSSPDSMFIRTGSGEAGAETALDTFGKNPAGTDPIDDTSHASKTAGPGFRSYESSRYRLILIISEGGQAIVIRAWDIELKSFVAIKTVRIRDFLGLTPRDQKNSCDRFVQEALITRRLSHPSVIPIYALDHWPVRHLNLGLDHLADGVPFLVLPYYPNGDLSKEIAKLHPADESKRMDRTEQDLLFRERLGSLVQVCRAVAQGHDRGIIHRDIKPKNILLGLHGEVYLADWGIAKSIRNKPAESSGPGSSAPGGRSGSDQTEWGYYGTRSYMSPEQANGDVHLHNESTDIFLVGATLYALAYGQAPFACTNPHESLRLAADCRVDYDKPLLPSADDSLKEICKKAMRREQADRYCSAMALAEDLERWLADQPLLYARENPRRKIARFLKRHSRSLAAATVVSLLGTGGLIVANYRISEARNAAVAAEKETTKALEEKSAALVTAEAATIEATKSKEEEIAARKLAEKNFAIVSDLSLTLLNLVSQKLASIPGLSKIRLEIAENLAEKLKTIANAPENRTNADIFDLWARVERESGNIARFIGDFLRANKHYTFSLQVYNGLAKSYPLKPNFDGAVLPQIDKSVKFHVGKVLLALDRSALAQLLGQFEAGEKIVTQAEAIVAEIRKTWTDERVDELEFTTLVLKSALLAQIGRDDEQRIVLERLEALEKSWFANLKAPTQQQFSLSLLAKIQRAEYYLRAKNPDASIESAQAALNQIDAKRKNDAANQQNQPNDLVIEGDTHQVLAEALHHKADPVSIRNAFEHYQRAYRIHESLDKEAKGAISYLDNLLWSFAQIRRFEREHQRKFEGLMDDDTALKKADILVAASDAPERRSLRAHILVEKAHRAADPQVRSQLAKRAAEDFDAAIDKLPLRADFQEDRKKLP